MINIKNVSKLSKVFKSSNCKRYFASDSENLVKTALYDMHLELGGDMVPFAGYELPVLYKGENGGVMKEHLWCREQGKASLFDVSHMGQVSNIEQRWKYRLTLKHKQQKKKLTCLGCTFIVFILLQLD